MIARPTDEEIAKLRRLYSATTPNDRTPAVWACIEANALWIIEAHKAFPVLLALVTQEGGEANRAEEPGPRLHNAPPARSSDAPERATSGGPFEYSEVCRHGFTGSCPICGAFPRTAPAPLPEGMETTAEMRADWLSDVGSDDLDLSDGFAWFVSALGRDHDRALAEIARLTAALAEADQLAAAELKSQDDRATWAREEEREAILGIVRGAVMNLDAQAVLIQAIEARARSTP